MKPELEIVIRKTGYQKYIAIIFIDYIEVWRTPDYHQNACDAFKCATTEEFKNYRIW